METISSPFRPRLSQLDALFEDKGDHAHADQVRAVDALEGLRDHGA
jgi:hypothetical protein